MTQPLTTTDSSIDFSSISQAGSAKRSDGASIHRFWKCLVALFWSYTETAGEADTSSYKGLL